MGAKMKFAAVFIAGAEAASLAEIAAEVNAKATTWTAQAPEKFQDTEDVKPYLGAYLPGDAKYESVGPERTDFDSSVQLPASFDSAEQWPQCSVIGNVRDQSSCGSCWAFGSVSSFESRACIATGKDVKYSPEQTAFCFNYNGCGGGNNVWRDFQSEGVVSGGDYTDTQGGTCSRYSLKPCAHHVPADEKYQPCPSSEYPSPSCPRTLCRIWWSMAPCMCLSVFMVISQHTSLVCTRTLVDPTLVAMLSLWLVMASLMAKSTGKSRTAGTRTGATTGIF